MENIWVLLISFVILLEAIAILLVANEDILYEPEEKIKKIIFIIFIPIIGAIIELRKLDKFARYTVDENGNEIMTYAFWDYYITSHTNTHSFGEYNDGGSGD